MNDNENDLTMISETENFVVWMSEEEEEAVYHIELGGITLHVTPEEWDEMVTLFKAVA